MIKDNWNFNKKNGLDLKGELGNTNTPFNISKEILFKLYDFSKVTKDFKFLEPCVGLGSFVFAVIDLLRESFNIQYILTNMIYCVEYDPEALNLFKKELMQRYDISQDIINRLHIYQNDFLIHDFDISFDLIATNPPYIGYNKLKVNKYFNTKEEMIAAYQKIDSQISNVSDIYIYFHIKSLKLLKKNGQCIFLCSDSWVDSKFGSILYNKIFSNNYNLDILISNRFTPFFRDDTSAIITKISKSKQNITKIYQLDDQGINFDLDEDLSVSLTKAQLKSIIYDPEILNKRNYLILFYKEYNVQQKMYQKYKNYMISFGDVFDIETTSKSFNSLNKLDIIKNGHQKSSCPVFFQIQARINRIPLYKNNIKINELKYSISNKDLKDNELLNLKKENNIYMSSIIDRFPLFFYVKNSQTVHISKYLSLKVKDEFKNIPIEILIACLRSFYSLASYELLLKEGTRKTLRKNEMGYAKEVRKNELKNIKILNPRIINEHKESKNIIQHQQSLENKIIYNMEIMANDQDFLMIENSINSILNIKTSFWSSLKSNVIQLYLRRMRNEVKILGKKIS